MHTNLSADNPLSLLPFFIKRVIDVLQFVEHTDSRLKAFYTFDSTNALTVY